MSGISNASGSINVAIQAMRDVAEKDRLAAEASRDKARLIGPKDAVQSDNIKAALAEARGTAPGSDMSPAERLAALKAKRNQAA